MEINSYQINRDNEAAFEQLFKKHFRGMHSYAFTLVKDDMAAEEIVQNIFYKLWEKEEQIEIRESVSGYLYRSVYNDCLNYLKHLKVRDAYQSYGMEQDRSVNNTSSRLELGELEKHLEKALNELPEKCRTIFQMSRFEELRYQERSEEHTSELQSRENLVCRLLLE